MTIASKIAGIREELNRQDASAVGKLLSVTQRGLWSTGLSPELSALRCKIVEIRTAPKVTRGLSDLVVRRAENRDVEAMCAVAGGTAPLFRKRLAAGDLGFVGELDGEILCYTWFHGGPTPFDEDRTLFLRWGLDASSYWSYDAMSKLEARSSGIFVRVFQLALREIFDVHHAVRVQGFIYHTNDASLSVHQRLGFEVLGELTAIAVPGLKWVHWEGPTSSRNWLRRRGSDFALSFPPV